ncbi:MAG: MFS transporter, partial [Alphaproteobacteria bacterium]|nr:MFS transporter [Alphaproteobacteria bacterium]
VSKSLLDFETSIGNELTLELLTGKEFNLERARTKAVTGDIAGATADVMEQMQNLTEEQRKNPLIMESMASLSGLTADQLNRAYLVNKKLTKEQKEAVGILSIGTFFEQFDIMLYIHMAVLLNELFFPQTDQNVASLLSAFTFCSTFIFIPIGALIFGWVGDNIGRKSTVVLTTLLTALSCLTIAFLPTYAEIGIKASIIMIGCRILQSMASMGEVIGALVYITEFTKPPIRYYAVALIPVLGYSGGLAALGVASLIVYAEVNWRGIFVFGALIALVGIAIRTKLSETKDFANASKRLQTQYNVNPDEEDLFYDASYKKTSFAMFCTQCAWPLCFYFVFIYCSQMLKSQFEYSVLDIIKHNFVISIFPVVSCFIRAKLSK